MKLSTLLRALAILLVLVTAGGPLHSRPEVSTPEVAPRAGSSRSGPWVANAGQWAPEVHFRAEIAGARVWVTADGFVVDRLVPSTQQRVVFRVRFEGETANVRGVHPQLQRETYLRGSLRARPQRFAHVILSDLQPGVDVRLRSVEGQLEYDLLVDPGARSDSLVVALEGATIESVDAQGRLRFKDPLGQIGTQSAPRSFTREQDRWAPTPSEVCLLSETRFTLRAPSRRSDVPLLVDPGLEWSTFLGTSDTDRAIDVAVAANGDVFVVGDTASFDFPTTTGVLQPTSPGGGDVFVSRLSADGSALLWSTFLGGSASDSVSEVHVDANGDVLICGSTFSSDFPTTPGAFRTSLSGVADAFVTRLDGASGQTLLASTFVGGSGFELSLASAVTPLTSPEFPGSIVVVGSTNGGFPVTPLVWQGSFGGGPSFGGDGFVTRLREDLGSAEFSTYLGGSSGSDSCFDVAVRPSGEVVVAGSTDAADFAVSGGAQPNPSGGTEGFLFELSADGRQRLSSTFFGGSAEDRWTQIALTDSGEVIAAGDSTSSPLPQGAAPGFQSALSGGQEVVVARYSADLSVLRWVSRLGGVQSEEALGLVIAPAEEPIVVGGTRSRQFPITPWSFDSSFSGPFPVLGFEGDAFATRLSADGTQLEYSTFLGGPLDDQANGIALDAEDRMVLAGQTASFQFPTTIGAFDTVGDGTGLEDGWTAKLDFARFPFVTGAFKPTSIGNQPLSFPSGFPSVSGGNFSVSIDGAEPNTGFTLLLGSTNLVDRPFFGGRRFVGHPIQRIGSSPLGFFGSAAFDVPGDAGMIGQTWRYQFWFQDPGDPFGVGLSDAIEVTYVP